MLKGFILFLFIVLVFPAIGKAQTMIAGVPVNCMDAYGVPVMTIPAPLMPDWGRARIEPNGLRVIYLNPTILNVLPLSIRLFTYAHECAHHHLGHTYGFQQLSREKDADCWAIRIGREQGWITPKVIDVMAHYFRGNPGSPWGHLPGPQRLQNFVNCYNS